MKLLVVKTSSLGDVLHCLPAVTEARAMQSGLEIHWLVEEQYAEIPAWHPAIAKVIAVAVRRWRNNPVSPATRAEWRAFRRAIKGEQYDLVIDAQGLLKSALLARQSGSCVAGYDWQSCRESPASLLYRKTFRVERSLHAVERIRRLFAMALGYRLVGGQPGYAIDLTRLPPGVTGAPYLVWVHGSAWKSKLWPRENWLQLSRLAVAAGFRILVPWGNEEEQGRAHDLARQVAGVTALPKLKLSELAAVLSGAVAVVGVDTGLSHLAAAVGTPSVTLYGPTDPARTGTWGNAQHHLKVEYPCAPCFSRQCRVADRGDNNAACLRTITAAEAWARLREAVPGLALAATAGSAPTSGLRP